MFKNAFNLDKSADILEELVNKIPFKLNAENRKKLILGVYNGWYYYASNADAKHVATGSANVLYGLSYLLAASVCDENVSILDSYEQKLHITPSELENFTKTIPYGKDGYTNIIDAFISDWLMDNVKLAFDKPVVPIDYSCDRVIENMYKYVTAVGGTDDDGYFLFGLIWATSIFAAEYAGLHNVIIQEISYNINQNNQNIIDYCTNSGKTFLELYTRYTIR